MEKKNDDIIHVGIRFMGKNLGALLELKQKFRQRLAFLGKNRDQISRPVYEKLSQEYDGYLRAVDSEVSLRLCDYKVKLAEIHVFSNQLAFLKKSFSDIVQEIELRYALGEYTREQFEQVRQKHHQRMKQFEENITKYVGEEKRIRDFLDQIDFEAPAAPVETAAPEPVAAAAPEMPFTGFVPEPEPVAPETLSVAEKPAEVPAPGPPEEKPEQPPQQAPQTTDWADLLLRSAQEESLALKESPKPAGTDLAEAFNGPDGLEEPPPEPVGQEAESGIEEIDTVSEEQAEQMPAPPQAPDEVPPEPGPEQFKAEESELGRIEPEPAPEEILEGDDAEISAPDIPVEQFPAEEVLSGEETYPVEAPENETAAKESAVAESNSLDLDQIILASGAGEKKNESVSARQAPEQGPAGPDNAVEMNGSGKAAPREQALDEDLVQEDELHTFAALAEAQESAQTPASGPEDERVPLNTISQSFADQEQEKISYTSDDDREEDQGREQNKNTVRLRALSLDDKVELSLDVDRLNSGDQALTVDQTIDAIKKKTIKCPVCGTMNYSIRWYCEKCEATLTSL